MATKTVTGVSGSLAPSETSKTAATLFTGNTNGIKITKIKFIEPQTVSSYLSTNGKDKHYYLTIKGSVSGSKDVVDIVVTSPNSWGGWDKIGEKDVNAFFKGDITLVASFSTAVNYNKGMIGQGTVEITYEDHPTVSAGTAITKTQMDALKSYLGKGTAVTQGGTATATVGNTYKSGLTAGTSAIDDAWYNGA